MKQKIALFIVLLAGIAAGYFLNRTLSTSRHGDSVEESLHDHEAGTEYTCSMHPQIRSDKPGKCPICGMDLIPVDKPQKAAAGKEYTCSMHPQIRSDKPGKCPICGMDLIPVEETASSGARFEMTPEAVALADIQTVKVGTEAGTKAGSTLTLNGKLEADETAQAGIVAHIPGRIEQLYVRFTGELVKKGDKVATIYSPDLITAQKELLEAGKIKDVSPGLFDAALNKLKYWKIPQSQIDRILASGKVQEEFDIFAEYSGVVTKRNVVVADHVMSGTVLFEVTDLSKLWVLFDVYESDLAKIRLGDRIEFTTAALPGKTFRARINFIDPMINPQTRTASVRAVVRNSYGRLKPEMFVIGKLFSRGTGKTSGSLVVPKTAVLWTGERSVVYVKVPDAAVPTFEFREVVLGEATGDGYRVLEGLSPGEEVVRKGAFMLDAVAQLNNSASMMNRHVTVSQ